ncbi:MAG: class II glutamine amidotransferase [Deltaproteobacteria bacterium]|nr:class II glutamine amidotransferase [Deltaproteobacteria bacterium]
MIGFASVEAQDVAPYLASLARFCESGNLVAGWEKRPGGNHPNGWGVAWRVGDEMRMVKSGKPAATDSLLSDVRARTDRFIGHVRYASNPETVCAANSHPFQALGVTLAHNGTFYGKIGAEGDARNVSDSVVFLELLEDRWKERTLRGLSETLRGILSDHELVGEYSAANLLIAAGDALFALRRYQRNGDYYTLYLKPGEGLTVVASEPLDADPGWRLLADGELVELSPGAPRSLQLTLPA